MTKLKEVALCLAGGGITGASLLYHLAHEGWTDTLLVERIGYEATRVGGVELDGAGITRVVLCGMIGQYNAEHPPATKHLYGLSWRYLHRWGAALMVRRLGSWM